MDQVTLKRGDCMELMKSIPDGTVDMILCDPPYGTTKNRWDSVLPLGSMWKEYNRIAKEEAPIVLFTAEPFTSSLVMSNLKDFKYNLVWYKHYTRNFLNAHKQFLRTTELITVFYRKQCKFHPIMTKGPMRKKGSAGGRNGCYGSYGKNELINDVYFPTDILDFIGVPSTENEHPTQKPVPLLEYLLETFTDPGDLVLDNCMGSGSTGVACVNKGRRFIGFELEPGYFHVARKRIEEAQRATAQG